MVVGERARAYHRRPSSAYIEADLTDSAPQWRSASPRNPEN
jgi:hypothetical protein